MGVRFESFAKEAGPRLRHALVAAYGVDVGADEYLAPAPPPCPGDVTGDGTVNILDLVMVRNNFGTTCDPISPCPGDATGDGVVNILDKVAVRNAFGTTCP